MPRTVDGGRWAGRSFLHAAARLARSDNARPQRRVHLLLHPLRRGGDAEVRSDHHRDRGVVSGALPSPAPEGESPMTELAGASMTPQERDAILRDIAGKLPVRPNGRKRMIWMVCMA